MKISRVIIKKFRSIKKADIWVESINAIVGQNNSGKSCLLRALNVFFNYEKEEKAFVDGAHSFAPRSISKIEIHFDNFDTTRTPRKYVNNNKVIIEAAFQLNTRGCKRTVKYKSGNNWITDGECIEEIKSRLNLFLSHRIGMLKR